MIFHMPVSTFTSLHVLMSLVALVAGFISVYGMLNGRLVVGWMSLFLWTAVLTSVSGFLFPFDHLDPALVLGVISLAVLAITIVAWSGFGLVGSWRWIFAVGAITALYLDAFVFVAQAFNKLPPLRALAPTGMGPVFALAQVLLLAAFVAVGFIAVRRFRAVATDASSIMQSRALP
jgi:hypothetical protein